MKQFLGLVSLLITGCQIGQAQRQDTIYQSLATNYISTNISGDLWGPVTNIGQAFHQAFITVTPQSGKTCHSGSSAQLTQTRLSFQVQLPGQTAINVANYEASPNYNVPNGALEYISSVINHPYVYIFVTGIDITNCQYSLTYSGSLYPGFIGISPLSFSIPVVASYNTSGSHTAFAAIACCVNIQVMSLNISNATAGQTVTVECGTTVLATYNNLAAGQIINFPLSSTFVPIVSCFNNNLNFVLANSSEVDIIFQPNFQ